MAENVSEYPERTDADRLSCPSSSGLSVFHRVSASIVRFLNEQGLDETESLKAVSVQIRQTGEQMPVMTFFSKDYFYGDYIRMSPHLIEKYHLSMPASPIHPWPVNETDYATYRHFCKLAAADLSLDIKKRAGQDIRPDRLRKLCK